METWEGTNRTRIDLKKDGETILTQKSGRWEPFRILSHDPSNRRVKGVWILSDETVYLKGGQPTYPINEEWILMYIDELRNERNKLKRRIEVLQEIWNIQKF